MELLLHNKVACVGFGKGLRMILLFSQIVVSPPSENMGGGITFIFIVSLFTQPLKPVTFTKYDPLALAANLSLVDPSCHK